MIRHAGLNRAPYATPAAWPVPRARGSWSGGSSRASGSSRHWSWARWVMQYVPRPVMTRVRRAPSPVLFTSSSTLGASHTRGLAMAWACSMPCRSRICGLSGGATMSGRLSLRSARAISPALRRAFSKMDSAADAGASDACAASLVMGAGAVSTAAGADGAGRPPRAVVAGSCKKASGREVRLAMTMQYSQSFHPLVEVFLKPRYPAARPAPLRRRRCGSGPRPRPAAARPRCPAGRRLPDRRPG